MHRHRTLWVGLVFLVGIMFLQYRLWWQPGGIHDLWRLKKDLAAQIKTNEQLYQRNEDLLAQIQRLQTNQEAVETRARSELGMIKKDETFYQVVR